MKNEAQLAFRGHVSNLVRDPATGNDMSADRNGGDDILFSAEPRYFL